MGNIDPNIGWPVIAVLILILNTWLNILRVRNSGLRKPTVETELGTISTRMSAIEKDLEGTKARIGHTEEKLSRQVGALHGRINDVFGELKMISGMLKTHQEDRNAKTHH